MVSWVQHSVNQTVLWSKTSHESTVHLKGMLEAEQSLNECESALQVPVCPAQFLCLN